MDEFESLRREMVTEHLARRGISDRRLLEAFLRVPRDGFVPPDRVHEAYADHPVEIGYGQTTSQPYMIAVMLDALRLTGTERVLEIGTGSGYQTALLALLSQRVTTVERLRELAQTARLRLNRLGIHNVDVYIGDGTMGWPDAAPFDRIVVGAGAPHVPKALVEQLAEDGFLAIPVGSSHLQTLRLVHKRGGHVEERDLGACLFVRLVGRDGWAGN
ncbi:MAG: protein-L-isoaspartate(D-aspartate) O-methyltransferase [Planctomycetes bacterium]|nr:protein-L-isoaspartate(D-aspartate) O-methyltransferase [Planctomycetota bacterium]